MSRPATPTEKMSREELLAYVQMLEGQVRHDGAKIELLNATVRKLESDAVVTVAALVHQMGGEAVIMPNVVEELRNYQIGRTTRHEDNATILRVAKKPDPAQPAEAPEVDPSTFQPDGL